MMAHFVDDDRHILDLGATMDAVASTEHLRGWSYREGLRQGTIQHDVESDAVICAGIRSGGGHGANANGMDALAMFPA
jgi:hypothetical protein